MRALVVLLVVVAAVGCGSSPVQLPLPGSTTVAGPVEVVAALTAGATVQDREAIEAAMRAAPGAGEPSFETSEQAYERFKEVFADDPELVEQVRPEELPETWRVRMPDATSAQPLVAALRELPGIDDVSIATEPGPPPTR